MAAHGVPALTVACLGDGYLSLASLAHPARLQDSRARLTAIPEHGCWISHWEHRLESVRRTCAPQTAVSRRGRVAHRSRCRAGGPLAERAEWTFHRWQQVARQAEPVCSGVPASNRQLSEEILSGRLC